MNIFFVAPIKERRLDPPEEVSPAFEEFIERLDEETDDVIEALQKLKAHLMPGSTVRLSEMELADVSTALENLKEEIDCLWRDKE